MTPRILSTTSMAAIPGPGRLDPSCKVGHQCFEVGNLPVASYQVSNFTVRGSLAQNKVTKKGVIKMYIYIYIIHIMYTHCIHILYTFPFFIYTYIHMISLQVGAGSRLRVHRHLGQATLRLPLSYWQFHQNIRRPTKAWQYHVPESI